MNVDELAKKSATISFSKEKEKSAYKILKKGIGKNNLEPLYNWFNLKKDNYYKIGWAYLYNHYDVEDVFQNTIIKTYKNINKLRNPRFFETWVTSIFINECKAILRSRKKVNIVENLDSVEASQEKKSYLELEEGLKMIGNIHKEVIILKYISGYSQEEISLILKIPIGTVKSRIYRGLKLLKNNIREVE